MERNTVSTYCDIMSNTRVVERETFVSFSRLNNNPELLVDHTEGFLLRCGNQRFHELAGNIDQIIYIYSASLIFFNCN